MTKTRITKAKQKLLMKYLPKFLAQKDAKYDFDLFYKTQQARFAALLDQELENYYGKQWIIMQEYLISKGIDEFMHKWFYAGNQDVLFPEYNKELEIKSKVVFSRCYGPIEGKDCSVDCTISTELNDKWLPMYLKALKSFNDQVAIVAKPFINLIQSAKYCEDISNVWEDAEVLKILTDRKIFPISAITKNDINFIKEFTNAKNKNSKKSNK